jgi:hypothetical protein
MYVNDKKSQSMHHLTRQSSIAMLADGSGVQRQKRTARGAGDCRLPNLRSAASSVQTAKQLHSTGDTRQTQIQACSTPQAPKNIINYKYGSAPARFSLSNHPYSADKVFI